MPELKDYPHKAVFEASPIIYASSLSSGELETAKASLDNLRGMLPSYVDFERNIDLLGVCFNGAVANLANLNDDVIGTQTAINVMSLWENKFINLEHDRSKIIGHILRAGFSSYGESNILYPMDIQDTKDPFNLCFGGVIYRIVDKATAAKIEESANPESPNYQTVSTSWELAFADYSIALGSRNLKDAEIIQNPKQVEELKKHLKAYGGDGRYGSSPIYRVIGNECLPLAMSVTRRPAASVKGIVTHDSPPQKTSVATFFGSFFKNSDDSQKTRVTQINPKNNMEKIEQILEEIKASLLGKKVTEEAIAGIHQDISKEIIKANEEWLAKINESKAAKEKAEAELTSLKATQEAQATELAATKQKLADLEAKASAEAAANLFSSRMAEMDAEFELDDEDRQVLASDIKTLDEKAETFAAYKDKMGKLMKDKKKGAKDAKASEVEAAVAKRLAEIAKASAGKLTESELAQKALEEAKASEKLKVPNNNGGQNEKINFREKFATAFKDSVVIK